MFFFTAIRKLNSVQRGFFFSICILILGSCVNQQQSLYQPVSGYADTVVHDISLLIGDITETKAGAGNENIPEWLIAFFNGGVEELERMESFMNRYCYVIEIEGDNFGALNKWADNFSVAQDFSRQAAARIERRLIASSTSYPDDDYGDFYESTVKKAFDAEYADAFLEDTFWVKRRVGQNGLNTASENSFSEVYEFFVFISIDKDIMQAIIVRMMAEALAVVTPTRAQNNAIRRLQQIFFVGF